MEIKVEVNIMDTKRAIQRIKELGFFVKINKTDKVLADDKLLVFYL